MANEIIMNMKKILSGMLAAVVAVAGLSSCSLDSVVYSQMTESNYPLTEEDAQSLLDGMYGYLKTNSGSVSMSGTANTGWGWPYWSIGEIGYYGFNMYTTDECRSGDTGTNMISDFLWGLNSQDWMQTFQIVKNVSRLTQIIDVIENCDGIAAGRKAEMVAEAKCLRGITMYVFHDLFGTFHVTLDPKELDNIKYEARPSEEEFVGWMEKDFTEAIPALYEKTNNTSNWGRLNKATAYMFLAKIAMRHGDYAKAKSALEPILSMGYRLADDYFAPFSEEGEEDDENIYCIPSGPRADNEFYFYMTPWNCQAMLDVNPGHTDGTGVFETVHYWGGARPTWTLYDAFDPSDVRRGGLSASFLSTDKDANGEYIVYTRENPGSSVLQHGCNGCKYFYSQDRAYAGDMHAVMFRYADVLMMLAECDVKINNSVTPKALGYLKQITDRAGVTNLVPAAVSSDVNAFMEYFKDERFREFYLEGWRRDDLIRWGDFVKVNKDRNKGVTDDYQLMPIPTRVINESEGVISQNPGY